MMFNCAEGVIIGVKGGFAEVGFRDREVLCRIRGKLRLIEYDLVAGDMVKVSEKGGGHVIEEVLPRRNFLARPPVANLDCVAIFTPLKTPPADLMLTDRLCILAERQGLSVVICATKADIADDEALLAVSRHYEKAGYQVIGLSAPKGEGVERLKGFLDGRISIFAGQSGAGKSTLINAILPGLGLETSEVSERIGRGRHTTRQVRLLKLGRGSYVADSPGFSSLDLTGVGPDDLRGLMPDIAEYEGLCRFNGCRHGAEPGCAVKGAVSDGEVGKLRYDHYITFLNERLESERNKYN